MKALITITTCNRLSEVKKYIWEYLSFVNANQDFHFVLALDGKEQSYIDFCDKYAIPLVYSEEREGVGLSKNRVLTKFPEYDYYFFVEDDVELVHEGIFNSIIKHHHLTFYPHFCGNTKHKMIEEDIVGSTCLQFSKRGGGYFNFFSKEGQQKVGGFHTLFAKYKRFGHTEHTYRFYRANLQPAPFIFSPEWRKMILVHSPEPVSKHSNLKT